MKTISLKLLKQEDIDNLKMLEKHLRESRSTVIRQALRFYARSLGKTPLPALNKKRKEAAA